MYHLFFKGANGPMKWTIKSPFYQKRFETCFKDCALTSYEILVSRNGYGVFYMVVGMWLSIGQRGSCCKSVKGGGK